MSTTIALVVLAIAACSVTGLAITHLFRDDRGFEARRDPPVVATVDLAPMQVVASEDRKDLEAQVDALRGMILQLRYELAEAQRANEQSRVRDLQLLRFREAELVRAETRAVTDLVGRRRSELLSRDWSHSAEL